MQKKMTQKAALVQARYERNLARETIMQLQEMMRHARAEMWRAQHVLMSAAELHQIAGHPSHAHLAVNAAASLIGEAKRFDEAVDCDVDEAITRLTIPF